MHEKTTDARASVTSLNAKAEALRAAWHLATSLTERRQICAELETVYAERERIRGARSTTTTSAAAFGATFSSAGRR